MSNTEFCIFMEIQKVEKECVILREVKVILYKDRSCSLDSPSGLFFPRPNHIKIAIFKYYPGITVFIFCFIMEWPRKTSVLLSPLALNTLVWCGTMVSYGFGVCQLLELLCFFVKGITPRNKTVKPLDWIVVCVFALQNCCIFWCFSSILLSICLFTSPE